MEAILMHDTVTTLTARNADFARHGFVRSASMMPGLKTMVIGCADPRVDPAHVLGLGNGDARGHPEHRRVATPRPRSRRWRRCA